ncbi:hypothetical protein ACSSS7_003645 [Eimeria intestinalis]
MSCSAWGKAGPLLPLPPDLSLAELFGEDRPAFAHLSNRSPPWHLILTLRRVQRTGRAGSTAVAPSAPTAVVPAPESETAMQPLERTNTVDQQAAELVSQPPLLEPLREGDPPPPLALPPPHLSRRTHLAWMAWPTGVQARLGIRLERVEVIAPLLRFWRRRCRLRSAIAHRGVGSRRVAWLRPAQHGVPAVALLRQEVRVRSAKIKDFDGAAESGSWEN